MMKWFNYLFLFVAVSSWLGMFLYKKFAIHSGIVSNPNYRTLHESPIPSGGGVVFSLIFLIAIFLTWQSLLFLTSLWLILGLGGFLTALFGFIDDVKNIGAKFKLLIQILLSSWAVFWLYSDNVLILNWIPFFITFPSLLFLMIWMMNAYNFIDGVDGMAASGAIFVSLTLALVLHLNSNSIELMSIFILLAASVSGFIFYNWPPATIFMGDAGSAFLGFIFGSLLLFSTLNEYISIWSWLTVFGYFIADTTVTQIARVILVKKWYLPHRSHAYQNLARINNSHIMVTSGVTLYNLLWVFPLTLLSGLYPEMGLITSLLSITPAMIVAYKYGPRFSLS
jgi:Fuc2NAc and GlcNAc transferase